MFLNTLFHAFAELTKVFFCVIQLFTSLRENLFCTLADLFFIQLTLGIMHLVSSFLNFLNRIPNGLLNITLLIA